MSTQPAVEASPIRLTFLAICCIKFPEALRSKHKWRELFAALALALKSRAYSYPDDNWVLGEECILAIRALEEDGIDFDLSRFYIPCPLTRFAAGLDCILPDSEKAFREWCDRFDPDKSLFPDEFISALSTVARKEMRWYRVRRLMELE